jgi:hypothetical protein
MKMTDKFSSPIPIRGGHMYLLNGCGDVASTILTSNHREGNITHPEGGRREMGVMEIIYEQDSDNRLCLEESAERSSL